MHLGHYIQLLRHSQETLTRAFAEIGESHASEPDVRIDCAKFAVQTEQHVTKLSLALQRYADDLPPEPDRLLSALYAGPRTGPLGLLRDLHDLYLLTSECEIVSILVGQAARAALDHELIQLTEECDRQITVQLAWLRGRMKQAAPQALVVAR